MAESVIKIWNMAIVVIGEDKLAALDEDVKPAELAEVLWDGVRDSVLREHPWNCCMAQAELSALADKPVFKWAEAYQLPTDLLRIDGVYASDGSEIGDYVVQGKKILCNEGAPIFIEYVRREEDPQMYDPLLDQALAARLAAEIIYSLSGSTSQWQAMLTVYTNKLQTARGVDAREGKSESTATNDWLYARLGGRA
jgi:hypothetical protein